MYRHLIVLATLLMLWPIFQHEQHKYREYHHECKEQTRRDQNLLLRDVCLDPEDRAEFREMVDCEGAKKRLQISAQQCALHKWRMSSQVVHLYSTMTQSYWAILGWLLPLLFMFIWYLWKSQQDDKFVQVWERRQQQPTHRLEMDDGPLLRLKR